MPDESEFFLTNDGREVHIGDCVHLLPADPKAEFYIAKVRKIYRDEERKTLIQLRWYYRPQDLKHEPCASPLMNEVYHTNYIDSQSVESVISLCKVLNESEDTSVDRPSNESFNEKIYICRFSYSAETGRFTKMAVPEDHLGRASKKRRTNDDEDKRVAPSPDLIKALKGLEDALPKHKLPSFWAKERSEWMAKAAKSNSVKDITRYLLELEDTLQLLPSIGKADAKSRSAWIKAVTINQNAESLLQNIEYLKNYILQRCEYTQTARDRLRRLELDVKYHVTDNSECLDGGSEQRGTPIIVGHLYLIAHRFLPPDSPVQLKSIRAVMVSAKTECNVTIEFPSMSSIQKCFELKVTDNFSPKTAAEQDAQPHAFTDNKTLQPELDERFVMSMKLASSVLAEEISAEDIHTHIRDEAFWLVNQLSQRGQCNPDSRSSDLSDKGSPIAGAMDILMQWGLRRKVKFNRKHRTNADIKTCIEESPTSPEITSPGMKRRRGKRLDNNLCLNETNNVKENAIILKLPKDMQGRWNSERYRGAQLKLLDIMHEKGALPGRPILRPALREEARKHIGDTGLLDHLLKHMTDTVVRNGERFRRRHNSEGAMEYWLEPEELMDIRKEAGIADPFWIPPPGWKIGDEIPQSCYGRGMTAREAEELKCIREEVNELKKIISRFVNRPELAVKICSTELEDSRQRSTESMAMQIEWKEESKTFMKRPDLQNCTVETGGKNDPQPSMKTWSRCAVIEKLDKLDADNQNCRKHFQKMEENYRCLKNNLEDRLRNMSTSVLKLEEDMKQVMQSVIELREKVSNKPTDFAVLRSTTASPMELQKTSYLSNELGSTDKAVRKMDCNDGNKIPEKNRAEVLLRQNASRSGFRTYKPECSFFLPNSTCQPLHKEALLSTCLNSPSTSSNTSEAIAVSTPSPTEPVSSFSFETTAKEVAAVDAVHRKQQVMGSTVFVSTSNESTVNGLIETANNETLRKASHSNSHLSFPLMMPHAQDKPLAFPRVMPTPDVLSVYVRPSNFRWPPDLSRHISVPPRAANDVVRPMVMLHQHYLHPPVRPQATIETTSACQSSWLALAPPASSAPSKGNNR